MGPIQSGLNQLLGTTLGSLAAFKVVGQPGEMNKLEAKKYIQKTDAELEAGYKELKDIQSRLSEHEAGVEGRILSEKELEDINKRSTALNKKIVDLEQRKRFDPEYGRALRKQSFGFQRANKAREAFKRGEGPMPTDRYNRDIDESFAGMNPTARTGMMKSIEEMQKKISQRDELENLRNLILNPGIGD